MSAKSRCGQSGKERYFQAEEEHVDRHEARDNMAY